MPSLQIPILLSSFPLYISKLHIISKILHHSEKSLINDLLFVPNNLVHIRSRSSDTLSNLSLCPAFLDTFGLDVDFYIVLQHKGTSQELEQ